MGDKEGDGGIKKQQHSTSPNTQLDESTEPLQHLPHHHHHHHQQHHLKKPRYETGQWKQLPTHSPQTQTHNPTTNSSSSSPTPSSPSHSPILREQIQSQRKGKFVSPVWKPIEMLWLARAWRLQYQGTGGVDTLIPVGRGKTRAEKDKEVAEFLNLHGVNRDAKTAGTKWDNMLGEFRKVYDWEKGSERELIGKTYFRLSPYERKTHRLPASFDEDVYNELSQFMGHRLRACHTREETALSVTKSLKEDETPPFSEKAKQEAIEGVGFESSSKDIRRIGRIRMTWEESLSLWAEEGEYQSGRIKLQGLNFLGANELTFLDDSMVSCTMEAFEDGRLKGFSIDKFICGQQVKVFGRRKSSQELSDRVQLTSDQPVVRSVPPLEAIRAVPLLEYQDPTDHYLGYLRVPPPTLPNLSELSWLLQEPPPQDLRFPLRKEVYKDLPQGKELFFTTSTQPLDCRSITFDILSSIIRSSPIISTTTASTRDSYIPLWDDCINRVISKFCSEEMTFIRKPSAATTDMTILQDQWPNVTGVLRKICLWRGEETDQIREGHRDPSSTIVEKILWSFHDLPYILGYYTIGYSVTFCALSICQDRVTRTDLYSLDLSTPTERLKALIPCWRIAGLLTLLCQHCSNNYSNKSLYYSDFEILDIGKPDIYEHTPNTVRRTFSSKRNWVAVKEIYDFLDQRIPHAEYIFDASEKEQVLVFKPRGCIAKPRSCEELVEALKFVTKALVALHDLSFMHREIGWDKVRRRENEWFVIGFDEAVGAPQIYPRGGMKGAPEMGRGVHGVKVDVWGVGQLVKTCGLAVVPKLLKELEKRCLDQNPELRPTAADCYHHLLQLQSSISATASGGY